MAGWALDAPARLAALDEVDVYPGAPADAFAVFVRLVTRFLDVPTALVSFVNDECQFFPALTGLAEPWATQRQTPLSMSFCQHVVTTDADLVVDDAEHDPRVQDNLAIPVLGVKAYLGVPMRGPGGETLGSVCAIDGAPRKWTPEDIETMHDIAEAISTAIAGRVSEHRRAQLASEASHELRTPLTRLRLELDELGRDADVDAAVARLQEVSNAVDDIARAAARAGVRDMDVDLYTVSNDVAAQMDAGSVRVEGDTSVVRSLRAIVHHVVALVVGAFDGASIVLAVNGDDVMGRIKVRTTDEPADRAAIAAARHLLLEQLSGRLLERTSPDVAFEIILPRA